MRMKSNHYQQQYENRSQAHSMSSLQTLYDSVEFCQFCNYGHSFEMTGLFKDSLEPVTLKRMPGIPSFNVL